MCVPDPLEANLAANKSRDNSTFWVPEPVQFSTLYKQLPRSIALSATIGAMVTVGGDLYTWGDNPHGELGQDHCECGDAHKYPEIVDALGRYEVVNVATGSSHTGSLVSCFSLDFCPLVFLSLASCLLSLVSCFLSLLPLVSGLLAVSGLWSLVSGLWSLVSGLWSLVSGLWSLVSGLGSRVSCLVCWCVGEKEKEI